MGLLSWLKGKPAPEPSAPEPEPLEDLEVLGMALQSSDGAARVDAARALLERWRHGDAHAATALAGQVEALLDDPEPQARVAGLNAVRLMRKPENLEKHTSAVLARLADKASPVRTAAVWTAVKLPGEVARAQVRAVLQANDEPLRFDAATALAQNGDAAGLPQLVAALRDSYRRQEALSAIMSLGDAAALPHLVEMWGADDDEGEAIGDFDRTMLAAALARLGDGRGAQHLSERVAVECDDRPVAVEWVGRLGIQDAVPALEALAEQEGDAARGAALRALGRLRAPGAEERLLAMARDAEAADDLRMDAAEGLAEIGSEPALAALRDLGGGEGELAELARELLAEVAAARAPS